MINKTILIKKIKNIISTLEKEDNLDLEMSISRLHDAIGWIRKSQEELCQK